MDLGSALLLGDGELRSGGADRPSILADALEAVFGAVFSDGGFDAARGAIDTALRRARRGGSGDARQGSQDPAAGMAAGAPHAGARVRGRRRPAARRTRSSSPSSAASPRSRLSGSGAGASRRTAEQAAAAAAYTEAVARERVRR
jgi:ribonuclease-3